MKKRLALDQMSAWILAVFMSGGFFSLVYLGLSHLADGHTSVSATYKSSYEPKVEKKDETERKKKPAQ